VVRLRHENDINVAKRERRRYVSVKGGASLTDCSIEAVKMHCVVRQDGGARRDFCMRPDVDAGLGGAPNSF
jgi:hypothetical protein